MSRYNDFEVVKDGPNTYALQHKNGKAYMEQESYQVCQNVHAAMRYPGMGGEWSEADEVADTLPRLPARRIGTAPGFYVVEDWLYDGIRYQVGYHYGAYYGRYVIRELVEGEVTKVRSYTELNDAWKVLLNTPGFMDYIKDASIWERDRSWILG